MATRRHTKKRHTKRRGWSTRKTKLNRAKALHMTFGKQRAFAFANR